MNINTDTMVPISVANQNFSRVARLVDQYGSAVIMKNNHHAILFTNLRRQMRCGPKSKRAHRLRCGR